MNTTMKVKRETLEWLHALKRPGESLDDVLSRIKGDSDPVNVLEAVKTKMAEDAETRAEELHKQRIAEYLEKHRDQHLENLRVLGHDVDTEPDKRGFARFKKKSQG